MPKGAKCRVGHRKKRTGLLLLCQCKGLPRKIHVLQWGETEKNGAGLVRTVLAKESNSCGVTSLGVVTGFEGKAVDGEPGWETLYPAGWLFPG